jgi:predicted nucleic acid-binding Zn ribbon protein
MTDDKRHGAREPLKPGEHRRPEPIASALSSFLKQSGLARRVTQASVVPEWPALVGDSIASVTEPLFIARDGTLFVAVQTNSWMSELAMMERQLLQRINEGSGRSRVARIHWRLMR